MDEAHALRALQALAAWPGLAVLDDEVVAGRREANIFRVLRLRRREGVHTDMVGWLMNPNEWHGLGDAFAVRFIETCAHSCQQGGSPPWPRGPWIIKEIFREFPTGSGPIDILATGSASGAPLVLAIENKVDAPEDEAQLARYASALEQKFPNSKVAVVLLSPDQRPPNERPATVPWASVGYGDVYQGLKAALGERASVADGPVGTAIATQYLKLIGRHVMDDSDRIKAACRDLLRNHRDAWHLLRSHLPLEIDEQHQALGRACCQAFAQHLDGNWSYVVRKRMYAAVYRNDWKDFGTAPGSDNKYVHFGEGEADQVSSVHLRFALASEEDDAHANLEVRVKVPGPSSLGEKHHAALVRALEKAGIKVPGKDQFTKKLSSRLKFRQDELFGDDLASRMADRVCDDTYVRDVIRAVDSVLRP